MLSSKRALITLEQKGHNCRSDGLQESFPVLGFCLKDKAKEIRKLEGG